MAKREDLTDDESTVDPALSCLSPAQLRAFKHPDNVKGRRERPAPPPPERKQRPQRPSRNQT